MDYRKLWAALAVGLAIWYVPEFFSAGGELLNELAGPASDTAGEAYDDVVGNEPVSHGNEHIVEVIVAFDVNPRYHNWGQLLASEHQLPEITGSVFASRMVESEERTSLPAAGLRSQLRRDWYSSTQMRWTGIRARAGKRSTHLCVELHEATEGHNTLGTMQDILRLVSWDDWHLSDGDVPVSGTCVPLNNAGYPRDLAPVALRRPGESEPMGTLSLRFAGISREDLPPPGNGGWSTGAF